MRSSETFRQRCRRKRQADIQRTHHLLETRIGEQYPQQGPLDLLRQLRLALHTEPVHQFVHKRTIRFHHIVGQRKGIVPVTVENAKRRKQPRPHQRPCDGRPQNRISVIQQVIGNISLPHTNEIPAEQLCPVNSGGSPLPVVRIAAADIPVIGLQPLPVFAQLLQQGGLVSDFRLDDLPPYPFFQRLARLDLRPVVLALCPVGIEIHQHGVRHPVVAAEDDGRIVIRERIQQRQRHGRLSVLQHHHPDILDRNGNVLVGNRASYDLVFNHYVIESYGQTNEALYALVHKCRDLNLSYNDHFPVSKTRPFEYTLNDFATSWQNHFQSFMVDRSLDSDITAPLLIEKLRERYKIPEGWSDEDARAVIGMRYEFDLRGISSLPTYTFIEDISDENLSAILELNTPGLMVESSTVREYHTKYAAHILGYMGGMDDDDWAKYKNAGYSMDAYIGQSGFEEAFEDYLHGIDGQRVDVVSKDGTIVEQFWRVNRKTGEVYTPIAGNNVETTIDLELQGIAEDSLANIMKELTDPEKNTSKDESNGLDAEGAAVIVMKVKTGEILACASYPTYNLATMNQDWAEIEADPLKPFFNRAFGANYAPGSTFKMCTLIAAMEHRSTNPKSEFFGRYLYLPGEIIRDQGVFTKYPGFSPTCLIWTSNPGVTHGDLTAQRALEVSCNYFFYELGSRMTIEMLNETANGLGLGVPTGIELTEKVGWVTDEASKKAAYGETGVNSQITAGDRVLAAIGQAENRFSPLQLCIYASTLANKGTRMKATFLSRVVASDYSSLIKENSPEIMSQMEIASTTYNTYIEGMRLVIAGGEGTARSHFGGPKDLDTFPVAVCGKTGTAQHSSGGSDHGAFICFAPMEDPEIAVAVYGEKAAHGATLAAVAEDILRSYFAMEAASEVNAFENQAS